MKNPFRFWQEVTRYPVVLPIAAALLTLMAVNYVSFPWFDEIAFADTAANCVVNGAWFSHVWPYSYNPLHVNLLTAWFWLFGVSHYSVCAFGILCALLTCLVLQQTLSRLGFLANFWAHLMFVVAFWFGGWKFSDIIVNGRIDMLAALTTVVFVREITPATSRYRSLWAMFISAFFMMLASLYVIPVAFFYGIFLLLAAKTADDKKSLFRKGVAAAGGIIAAFALSCVYYGFHRHLFRFVHSYFSYNGTLSSGSLGIVGRVVQAYGYDASVLCMLAVVIVCGLLHARRTKWPLVIFVSLIPLLAVIGGRYESYYGWLYYLPVLAAFVASVSKFGSKVLCFLSFALLASGIWHVSTRWSYWTHGRMALQNVRECVRSRPDVFSAGQPIVMADLGWSTLFYYELVRVGSIPWAGDGRRSGDIMPQEKFARFVDKWIANRDLRQKAMDIFVRVEENPKLLQRPYYQCKVDKSGNAIVSWIADE